MFLCAEPVGHDVGNEVVVEICDVRERADSARDEDAGEQDADGAEGEVVVDGVDEREDLEERIVDAVDKRRVQVHEGDSGVLDRDLDGFDERGDDDAGRFDIFLVDFRLRAEAGVVREGAEARRAAEQDVRGGGLGHEEEHEDPDGPRDPQDLPQRPAPSLCRDSEAGEERAERGAAVGGRDPEGEGVREFEERVHVLHGGAAVSEARAAEEALEEAEDEEAGEVLDEGRRDGQDDEDEHRDGVDGAAADDGNFAQGGEDERAHAVGEDVEGEGEGGVGGGDAEFGDDAGFAGGVDGGAAVDGKGVGADEGGDETALAVGPVLGVGWIVGRVPVDEDVAV